MGALSKFLSPQKAQVLSQAFDTANKITDITKNPVEAMQRAGITANDLATAKRLLNNPLSGFIVNRLGVSKEEILAGIDKAETLLKSGTNSLPWNRPPWTS